MSKKRMTIEKAILLDLREQDNKALLKVALSKLKWLERFSPEEITIDILENVYKKVISKYPAQIAYIQSGSDSWVIMIKNTETHAWVNTVYSLTLFEGMAKTVLTLYAYFVKEIVFHN